MSSNCRQCGQSLPADHRFCSACGADAENPVRSDAAAETPTAQQGPDSTPNSEEAVSKLITWARVAKTVALLAFALPWATVSCAGQQLTSVSGLGLASGTITVREPMTGAVQTHSGSPELLVLLAAAAIGFALFVSFLWARRKAAAAAMVSCATAALLITIEVFSRLPQELLQGARQARGNTFDASLSASMSGMLRVEAAGGFWLTIFALLAAIALNYLVRQRTPADGMGDSETVQAGTSSV